jgi:pilus assembly protein Flp/PilA
MGATGDAMATFASLLNDQSGASAAEYALILAIIGAAIAIASLALGNAISTGVNRSANCIRGQSSASCS